MSAAAEQMRTLARNAAAERLRSAAVFANLHAGKPLFKRIMKQRGGAAVVVRLDWPGVLRVFNPATGELLAESVPGDPSKLASPAP